MLFLLYSSARRFERIYDGHTAPSIVFFLNYIDLNRMPQTEYSIRVLIQV